MVSLIHLTFVLAKMEVLSQLLIELFQEAICLFVVYKIYQHLLNFRSMMKQTFVYFSVYLLFVVFMYVSFTKYRNRPPIFITTYLLMCFTLYLHNILYNESKQTNKQSLPRKSTILKASPYSHKESQPIKIEYSPQQHHQVKFQSFYHSSPNELQSPNLVARAAKSNLSSPKPENNSNISIVSPMIHPSKLSYVRLNERFKSPLQTTITTTTTTTTTTATTTTITTTTINASLHSPTYVTKPSTPTLRHNMTSILGHNVNGDNSDTILTPQKTTPEEIKLRTFSTNTSNFNFWTNQIMRHIITPFSGANQKRTEGPCGLRNVGNVCFMNSILQSLVSLPLLKSRLLYFSEKGLEHFGAYSRLISSLRSYMLDSDSLVHDPIKIMRELCIFAPNLLANPDQYIVMQSQQDAGEFFLFLIEVLNSAFQPYLTPGLVAKDITEKAVMMYGLSENLDFSNLSVLSEVKSIALKSLENANVSNDKSYTQHLTILAGLEWGIYAKTHSTPLYDLFIGQLVEARSCLSCQGISLNLESFTLLPLSIPDTSKLLLPIEEILELFSRIEGLLGREKLRCTRCEKENITQIGDINQTTNGLQDAQRRALITKLPDFLVIQLSRFHFDPVQRFPYKNTKRISFPLKNLDLSQVFYENVVQTNNNNHLYELKSVVVHSNGSTVLSGHYVAYTKISHKWYLCNDSSVSVIDMEREKSTNQILENAYILFYGRQI